jgi:hypothetical protein
VRLIRGNLQRNVPATRRSKFWFSSQSHATDAPKRTKSISLRRRCVGRTYGPPPRSSYEPLRQARWPPWCCERNSLVATCPSTGLQPPDPTLRRSWWFVLVRDATGCRRRAAAFFAFVNSRSRFISLPTGRKVLPLPFPQSTRRRNFLRVEKRGLRKFEWPARVLRFTFRKVSTSRYSSNCRVGA